MKDIKFVQYAKCIDDNCQWFGELNKEYKVINWMHSSNDCMLEGSTSGSTSRTRFRLLNIKEILKTYE